tara:strand:+ start:2427 stop:3680 length:1254 start_codon:yes stop_codon:yes gene_type:complete
MATAPIYCTHKELKRVYPQIDAFDTKTPVYGWVSGLTDFYDSSLDIFYSVNTGLITDLFLDGAKIDKIAYNTTETTQVKTAITPDLAAIDVDSTSSFGANDIIKIGGEYMRVTAVTDGDTLAIATPGTNRGLFGTSAQHHAVDTSVYKIIDASADIADATSAGNSLSFMYDTGLDLCLLIGDDLTTNDPNDNLIEAGEEFTTMITQFRTDASRYLDSKLDPNLPREQLKDKSGNFDYMIIRSSALIAAAFLIRSSDPTNEVANALMEEAQGNIDALNDGKAALSWQTTRDASRGIIRDVSYTDGSVRPVDTRGTWNGTFDLIRVLIVAGGALDGTATYSVWVKNSDKLGNQQGNQVVTAEKINGDYQDLAGGLQIRFAGEDKTSVATATNEWEIEVMGASEHIDASGVKSVHNSRWL